MLAPWTAFSQTATMPVIEIRSGQFAVVQPGEFFSATLAVRFNTLVAGTWRDRLVVPEGWNVLSPVDLPFTPTGAEEVRLIAVAVPRAAPEGNYTLHYVVSAESDPTRELARAEFTVNVPKISTLEIKSELTPDWAIAGEKVSVAWRLSNRGNHSLRIDLKARSTLDYATTLAPAQLQLSPGESAVVTGEVAIPPNLRREQNHAFLLDARVHDGTQVTQRTTSISTRIIPRFTSEADFDDNLKLSLRTNAISRRNGEREATGLQTELFGRGFLDVACAQQFDFLLRPAPLSGPNNGLLPHEQYTLNYRSKTLDLLLGDNLYALSPLTQRWLFGRGAGAEYHRAPLAVGSYHATTPWQSIESRQTGAFLQYDTSARQRLRANFLDQTTEDQSAWAEPHARLSSLQWFARPSPTSSFEAEGATSDNNQHANGDAYRARWHGRAGSSFFYDLERIYASPDYFGYYRDLKSTTGNATWQIDPRWQTHASFQTTETNLSLDKRKGYAPVTRTTTAGVDRTISDRFSASLDYNLTDFEYRISGYQPDFTQETATLGGLWHTGLFSIRAAFEAGQKRLATLPARSSELQRFTLLVYARPKPTSTYSLYLGTGDSRYNPTAQRETTIVGTAQWLLSEGFSARAALSYNRYQTTRIFSSNAADLNLSYDFLRGSNVQLGFRVAEQNNRQTDRTVALSYTLPLHVRTPNQRNRGSLEGVLTLPTATGPKPLAGVIVRLDRFQAATDREGRFVFPYLKPGRYTLSVDPASLSPGLVLEDSRPVLTTIERGQRARVELRAIRAARIDGEIALYAAHEKNVVLSTDPSASSEELSKTTQLRQMLVELQGPDGAKRRTVTDAWGRFTFDRLPPGEWTLRFDDQAVPPWHQLERKEFVVKLASGDTVQIGARVLPVHRPFKMIDDGWIGLSAK
ncbi:MAG: carboxypeptidase-like regulatory domain-containing protein [Nibricoccus sp.]